MKRKAIALLLGVSILGSTFLQQDRIYGEENRTSTLQESYFYNDNLQLVVGNVNDEIEEAQCLISSEECKVTKFEDAETCGVSTLILLDQGMKENKTIKNYIKNVTGRMFEDKQEKDKFAIAVMSDGDMEMITEFTDDRYIVSTAIENMRYEKKANNLGESVKQTLEYLKSDKSAGIKRIVIFSDGDNSNDKGGSLASLLESMKTEKFPIYTIGCGTKKQAKQVSKNLYAISKSSLKRDGCGYTGKDDDIEKSGSYLHEIYSSVKLNVKVPTSLMDGTEQPISLTLRLQNEKTIKIEKEQVYLQMAVKPSDAPTSEPKQEESQSEPIVIQSEDNKTDMLLYLIFGLLSVIVLVILGVFLHFILSKRKKNVKPKRNIRLTDYDISVNGGQQITEHKSRMDVATNKFVQLDDEYERTMLDPASYKKKNNRNNTSTPSNLHNSTSNLHNTPINHISFDDFGEGTVMLNSNAGGNFGRDDGNRTSFVQASGQGTVTISLKDMSNGRVFVKQITDEVVIGRSENVSAPNYISLSYDHSISKEHCKIIKSGNEFYVEDLGSLNHTYVRNREVTYRERIESGEIVTIGQSQVLFTVER